MKLRTQREALGELRQNDPDSCLTAYALRTMILSGRVPTIAVGRKRLIDMDTLPEYLCASVSMSQAAPTNNDTGREKK